MGNQFKRKFKAEIEAYRSAEQAFMDAERAMDVAMGPSLGDIRLRKDKVALQEFIEAVPCTVRKALLIGILEDEMW